MEIDTNGISKMMQHYLQIKEQYKDCIVFYRLGDFYEMFFDDAVKVSEMLELTLTGKNCGLKERAPMCGVPYHAADMYISKLVAMGEKVAICEQLTPPNKKELIERDVVKVVTAGTFTNEILLDEKKNNFIASIYLAGKTAAVAWADITTGEFFASNLTDGEVLSNLFNLLVKISPSEIISNAEAEAILNDTPLVKQGILPRISLFTESEFSNGAAAAALKAQLNVATLEPFGIKDKDLCVSAAGALVSYIRETQKSVLTNINNIKLEGSGDYMMLDMSVIRNLEIVKTIRDNKKYGTLLWLLDKTKTNMGARKLQSWLLSPLSDKDKINYRLEGVECFFNSTVARQSIAELLTSVKDIGRITGRISNNTLAPRHCIALEKTLEILPSIKFHLFGMETPYILNILGNIGDFSEIAELLERAINDEDDEYNEGKDKNSKIIKKGYNDELDKLRDLYTNSRVCIAEIEKRERERTGIKTLRISYNRVFGYYIEVTNSFKDKVPYDYIRKQTLTNAERYVTEELKVLEEKLLTAEEKAAQLEKSLFDEIRNELLRHVEELQKTSDAIAELDVLISLALVAREHSYVKPVICDAGMPLNIVDGRHPVVEATSKQRFVPNDCLLDNDENRTMIITGPNMAGKSTFMRQVAIITIMAHMGSFVPAKYAEIPLTDKIFTRIGASDSLISDQSTFMVEMTETAQILKNATENSLIILDEIGRGTSTFDGLSIAWSVIEYVTEKIKAKTLFATHYHELTELEGLMQGVKNYKITVKEMQGTIIFLRKIMRGGANKSFGIEVAQLAGVDRAVTERAKEILKNLEKSDVAKGHLSLNNNDKDNKKRTISETERIISDIDPNNLSPMQALSLLSDLKEKITREKYE